MSDDNLKKLAADTQAFKAALEKSARGYDFKKTVPEAIKWISRLEDLSKKAQQELSKDEEPGRAMSEFVGFLKGYDDTDWYDHFYS